MNWFISLSPVMQALIATLFTWGVTAAGASLVFFFKHIQKSIFNMMLGFTGGVMVAASFWSLLSPAITLAEEMNMTQWIVVSAGFLSGGGFLYIIDKTLPHLHLAGTDQPEGIQTRFQRSVLLVLAITLHNIPEGLAVGVAFGAVAAGIPSASLAGAIALAIGIGLQNFPEGAAVSIPLRREGLSRFKSFMYGQSSALVEPVAGVLGALLVVIARPLLPFALAFAAGAMIYVVVEELVPESQADGEGTGQAKSTDLATIGFLIGFVVMMVLDTTLG